MFTKIKLFFRRKLFNRKCVENYRIVRSLGSGGFAEIFQTQYTINKKYYTCKRFPKEELSTALRELYVLRNTNHICFPNYHNYQEDERYIYLFFDYISGKDLFDTFVRQLNSDIGGEENLKKYTWQMIYCLQACDSFHIQHLDIKLENFLVTNLDPPQLTLIDFGCAHRIYNNNICEPLHIIVGTGRYLPPEIEKNIFYKTSDVWSLGVCLWMLMTCNKPFSYDNDTHDYTFPTDEHCEHMEKMSPLLCDFFSSIFHIDPKKRITLEQLVQHPWLA